jgi:hypothetical protein
MIPMLSQGRRSFPISPLASSFRQVRQYEKIGERRDRNDMHEGAMARSMMTTARADVGNRTTALLRSNAALSLFFFLPPPSVPLFSPFLTSVTMVIDDMPALLPVVAREVFKEGV